MEREYYLYKHVFPEDENGISKVYIGITSQPVEKRWKNGKGYRRKHKYRYSQPAMAYATLKYDWDDIKHIVITEGLTYDQAKALESELIRAYRSDDPEFGYNIAK